MASLKEGFSVEARSARNDFSGECNNVIILRCFFIFAPSEQRLKQQTRDASKLIGCGTEYWLYQVRSMRAG